MKKNLLKTLFAGAFLTVLTPLTASADVEINETNFPDKNFREYLLWEDYGQDGKITDEEIAGINFIDVGFWGISSLQGIEYFTALTSLHCGGNNLTSLDVSKNTALTGLTCYKNQLTSLDVSKNTALTELHCYDNQLTSLDVSSNTALTQLWCDNNQLTFLDVSSNTELTDLACDENQLTSLNVSGCTALEYLSCGSNQLTSLNVSGCTALISLSCNSNQLTSLNVSGCTALISLFCYSNQLKGIAMDAFIESLRINTSSKEYELYIYRDSNDNNVCTRSQVAAIKEKRWIPYYYDYDYQQWMPYEGCDDDPSSITKPIVETENANTPAYNISGQKVTSAKKGIYIVNGHKVVIK